jgi:hypothetical protein
MDGDIALLSHLETGDPKAFESTFGILSGPISDRIKRNRKIENKSEYTWKIDTITTFEKKSRVNIKFTVPDIDKIVERAGEYRGEKIVNGRLTFGEPIKPGLTFEEAARMARADPDIKPLNYDVVITLEKTTNGWIVLPTESKSFMRIFYPFDMQYQEK